MAENLQFSGVWVKKSVRPIREDGIEKKPVRKAGRMS